MTRAIPTASAMGLRATTSGAATQLGLAIIPEWFAMSPSLTSGTTSGTSGSVRNADELSMTTAPASTAAGAKSLARSDPAENSAIWIPSNEFSVSSCTSKGLPR